MNCFRSGSPALLAGLTGLLVLLNGLVTPAGAEPPARPKIVSDTDQLKQIESFAKKSNALAKAWYPKIVAILGEGPPETPKQVTILMDLDYDGVAATGGTEIHVSVKYVHKHLDDLGMIVHELTHVVQGYPKYDPVWLVEGIADYVRFFHYEPVEKRPHPNPNKANCRDSYRTTAAFLDWASHRYDAELLKKLNHALHTGTYTEALFQQATGKDLDQLNTEWIASLRTR